MTTVTDDSPAPPAAAMERILVLDILRGLALAGMILVHFHQEIELDAQGLEDLLGWGTWIGVETKAWGIFALLFGVGFAVLLERLEARRAPVVSFYLRRLMGLALFGLVAEICFGFQILLEYAIWGLPLLLIRRWSTPALLLTAALAVVIAPMLASTADALQGWTGPGDAALAVEAEDPLVAAEEAVHVAEQRDQYIDLLAARAKRTWVAYRHWRTYLPGSSFALFILGLLAVRHQVFQKPLHHVGLIAGWMIFGFISWALAWLMYFAPPPGPPLAFHGFGLVQDQWLCFTYVGGILLLVARRPAWAGRLSFIGIAGRMALTNYLLQIAALDFLSSGYGIALRVRPLGSIIGTAVLFGALVLLSRWWLARFRYGPAEWLWRSFTYGQWQPLRRPPIPPLAQCY